MANKIQKQKALLITIAVLSILLGIALIVGGIVLIVGSLTNGSAQEELVRTILYTVGGLAMIIIGGFISIFGIRWLWVGSAVKATKGSIAETNLSKGTVNGKVCPKCGCTNTPDSTKCTSCGEEL